MDIVTRDSLRELSTPGLLAMLTPIAVGFGLGVGALGTFLAGTIATGTLMAVFLANSGGAWDNAKKFVEDGNMGGKNSDAHAATVIGDTVGDPFKDTAGPAINPLLKVMNLVALLIAPAIVAMTLDGQTGPRLIIAFGALAIIVGSLVASSRHRGGGEDLIDKMADRVHAEYEDAAAQRELDVHSVMPGASGADRAGAGSAGEGAGATGAGGSTAGGAAGSDVVAGAAGVAGGGSPAVAPPDAGQRPAPPSAPAP